VHASTFTAALGLACVTRLASADAIAPTREEAERLERQGRDGDPTKFVACGEAYLQIYNAHVQDPANDEILYNAAACFDEGHAIEAAIHVLGTLEKAYPTSKLRPRAVARLAGVYARTAQFDHAADQLEEYANKYAGERDAVSALREAITYRTSLGDDAKAIADTRFFVSLYGAKSRRDAAEAVFALTAIFERQRDANAVIENLRGYITSYAAIGGADRLVIAYAKLGAALWHQSCPNEVDGLCIAVQRGPTVGGAQRARCDSRPHPRATLVQRDPAKVKQAMAAFGAAIHELENRNGKTGGDDIAARYFYAQAKLAQADRDFETYLAVSPPDDLDFDPAVRPRNLARLDRWLARKAKLGEAATRAYERIFEIKDAVAAIAAAARLGLIAQTFADTLVAMPIPQRARTTRVGLDAYCELINDVAAPLEQRAAERFRICLERSSALGWFDSSSELCERELQRLSPEDFPVVRELHATPRTTASPDDVERPAHALEGAR
jgi:tetratricopeptide (TPR) repeat protein